MPPLSPDHGLVPPADLAACRALLRNGSRTFFAASLLLPRRVRDPASALYAFCRVADDAVDCPGRLNVIAHLRERLARIYERRPAPLAPDRALAEVVARFAIPRALPEALIEGFAWDASGRRYEDLAGVHAYSARVAGAVGAMMALFMNRRAPDVLARACDLGVAMQLSNIARDVGEDARAGRLYLPLEWMRAAGIEPNAWLARPVHSAALAGVIRRLLSAADELYARAELGIAALPADCRAGIFAARWLYAEIGREVERRGCDALSQRAVVPIRRKAQLLMRAWMAKASVHSDTASPPLEQVRFLVDAASGSAEAVPSLRDVSSPRTLDERAAWLVQLFERLERRERAASAQS